MTVVINGDYGMTTPESVFTDSSGNVGIGCTPTSNVALDIQKENTTLGDVAARIKSNNAAGGTDSDASLYLDAGSLVASTVTAGSFAIGTRYRIQTVGTTDFTLIGAYANTVGVSFIATGAGTGDGTAVTLNSGEAEIFFYNSGYSRGYLGWQEDTGYLVLDGNQGNQDGGIRLVADGPTGSVQVYGSNNGLTGITSKNTLRFFDADITTTTNQPVGVIDFYQADTSNGAGVCSYIMSAALGTTGGGDLRFGTAPAGGNDSPVERMRIDGSGNLLVGATTGSGAGRIYCPAIYNTTTASAANMVVDSNGLPQRSTSSLKYKKDVQDSTHGLSALLTLRSVTFKGKGENDGDTVFGGLIAEEVHEAGLTEFVQYAEDGSPDALAYGHMVSLCIKAIQEQQALITQLQADVAALKA